MAGRGAAPIDLLVFARRPRAGRVKRRLARALGHRHAAALYARTLAHTLELAAKVRGVRRCLYAAGAREAAWFAPRLRPRGWRVRVQGRGDLGQRMADALRASTRGDRAALLIGSDLLDVRRVDLEAAVAALAAGRQLVLGAAADGGYWLIGVRPPLPAVFTAMPWGTAGVLAATCAAARELGVVPTVLPVRRDLDRARDLFTPAGARYRRRTRSRSRAAT